MYFFTILNETGVSLELKSPFVLPFVHKWAIDEKRFFHTRTLWRFRGVVLVGKQESIQKKRD